MGIENESDDSDLKDVIFGLKGLDMDKTGNKNKNKRKNVDNDGLPALKKRKLNDLNVEEVKTEFVHSDEVIYNVSYALSASGIWDKKKRNIVWRKVFKLNEDEIWPIDGT